MRMIIFGFTNTLEIQTERQKHTIHTCGWIEARANPVFVVVFSNYCVHEASGKRGMEIVSC